MVVAPEEGCWKCGHRPKGRHDCRATKTPPFVCTRLTRVFPNRPADPSTRNLQGQCRAEGRGQRAAPAAAQLMEHCGVCRGQSLGGTVCSGPQWRRVDNCTHPRCSWGWDSGLSSHLRFNPFSVDPVLRLLLTPGSASSHES